MDHSPGKKAPGFAISETEMIADSGSLSAA
jgi:hypothetical protein